MENQSRSKNILPSVMFDVVLPTLDVYSDLSLIIPWFIIGHGGYGLSMTVPLLFQFASTAYKWFKMETPQDKKWSWVFLILQLWPQLKAFRVILLIYKNDRRANAEKKALNSEIGTTEPFLEAWPSCIIMTIIFAHAMYGSGEDNAEAVFGSSNASEIRFFISYSISIFTACFGMTKLMQIGPCPVLTEEGLFGGLLNSMFIIHFLAVMFSATTKILFVGMLFGAAANGAGGSFYIPDRVSTFAPLLLITFLPNLMLSSISIAKSTGFSKTFFEVILRYPALWLLPVATYFVVGPQNVTICYCLCNNQSLKYHRLGISGSLTALNAIFTFILYIPTVLIARIAEQNMDMTKMIHDWWRFKAAFVPVVVCGWMFTVWSFKCCCCPDRSKRDIHYINVDRDNNRIDIRQCDINRGIHS